MSEHPLPAALVTSWAYPTLERLDERQVVLQLGIFPGRGRNATWLVAGAGDGERLRVRRIHTAGWSMYKEGGRPPEFFGSDGRVERNEFATALEALSGFSSNAVEDAVWQERQSNYLIAYAPAPWERALFRYPSDPDFLKWITATAELLDAGLPGYSDRTSPRRTARRRPLRR